MPEPAGGAHADPAAAAANVKTAIVEHLRELLALPAEELLERRYERFRAFGTPGRQPVLPRRREPMTDRQGRDPRPELIEPSGRRPAT